MFVFVTREVLQSEWILFEAGYAYSRNVHVVPYCLPGTDLKHLPAPLQLLQASRLHCARDLSTLLKKCNETFQTKIAEKVSAQDFASIFRQAEHSEEKVQARAWEVVVEDIQAQIEGPRDGASVFAALCRRKHLEAFRESHRTAWTRVTSSGVTLNEQSEWFDSETRKHVEGGERKHYTFTLSPQLLGLTAPLVEAWAKKLRLRFGFHIKVKFNHGVSLERKPHDLTTKLFDSKIEVLDADWFGLQKIRFSLRRGDRFDDWTPLIRMHAKPLASCIPEIVTELLEREVLIVEDRDLVKRLKSL